MLFFVLFCFAEAPVLFVRLQKVSFRALRQGICCSVAGEAFRFVQALLFSRVRFSGG